MKNMKKFVATVAALSCALSLSVSALASEGTAEATYADGFVSLSDTNDINSTDQWTVIIISADDAEATLTADDLLYINQGTSADLFWTNGMGVLGGELEDGDYIIRIGGDRIASAGDLIEIPFTVGDDGRVIALGDVNFADGIGLPDLALIANHILGTAALEGDAAIAADVNQADGIGLPDLALVANYILGTVADLGTVTVK